MGRGRNKLNSIPNRLRKLRFLAVFDGTEVGVGVAWACSRCASRPGAATGFSRGKIRARSGGWTLSATNSTCLRQSALDWSAIRLPVLFFSVPYPKLPLPHSFMNTQRRTVHPKAAFLRLDNYIQPATLTAPLNSSAFISSYGARLAHTKIHTITLRPRQTMGRTGAGHSARTFDTLCQDVVYTELFLQGTSCDGLDAFLLHLHACKSPIR